MRLGIGLEISQPQQLLTSFAQLSGLVSWFDLLGTKTIVDASVSTNIGAWSTQTGATATSNGVANPIDGALTAGTMLEGSGGTVHTIGNPCTSFAPTGRATFTIYAKIGVGTRRICFGDATSSPGAYVNLSTGVVGTINGSSTTVVVTAVAGTFGAGWWKIDVTAAFVNGSIAVYMATADNSPSYSGDGTSTILLYLPSVDQHRLTSWTDRSGAGISSPATVAQAVTNGVSAAIGPGYKASDASFNGRPSLAWGVGDTALDSPLFAADLATPLTWLFAGKFTGATSNSGRIVVTGPSSLAAARRAAISNPSTSAKAGVPTTDSNGLFLVFGPSSTPDEYIDAHADSPFVACVSVDAANRHITTINNVLKKDVTIAGTLRTHGGWRFGRSATNAQSDSNWVGTLSAFVAYNRVLSVEEKILASDLMARTCGIVA